MQLERFKEHGIDLIEVSSHIDARPKYLICQGKMAGQRNIQRSLYQHMVSLIACLVINYRHYIYILLHYISPYNQLFILIRKLK